MLTGLLIILVLVLLLPFLVPVVEHNLEPFLFVMGVAATLVSHVLNGQLVAEILRNHLMYMITGAVLIAGILFKIAQSRIKGAIEAVLRHVPLPAFVFLLIVVLGLLSSILTAIIASLVLVEIIHNLPLSRREKVHLDIIACFSIGLGAVLTPVGEPLSTIVTSKMHAGFWYLMFEVGEFIIPGIVALGLAGVYLVRSRSGRAAAGEDSMPPDPATSAAPEQGAVQGEETYGDVVLRALKVFVFVLALELLGAGFRPFIDTYVAHLDSRVLYWINMISAIVDNATLAAAEVGPTMSGGQIEAILMGLLISGGMLIPGNIPNIISAGKLKIRSKEWAALGVPLGLILMVVYFVILFVIL